MLLNPSDHHRFFLFQLATFLPANLMEIIGVVTDFGLNSCWAVVFVFLVVGWIVVSFFPLYHFEEPVCARTFSCLALARDAGESIGYRLELSGLISDLWVVVLDFAINFPKRRVIGFFCRYTLRVA